MATSVQPRDRMLVLLQDIEQRGPPWRNVRWNVLFCSVLFFCFFFFLKYAIGAGALHKYTE